MKICLITAFPPSGRQLNEYGLYLARELQRNPLINLTILADKLTYYEWNTDANGLPIHNPGQQEMPGFDVIRCWESNRVASPLRLIKAVHDAKPDVVWFNLVYSTFGTPEFPVAAFAGLCAPAVTRAMGYFTHVTLHHIVEHVDFGDAGVKRERLLPLRKRPRHARALERDLGLRFAFGLSSHPRKEVFGGQCSPRHARHFRALPNST